MTINNENIFSQINRRNEQRSVPDFGINPENSTLTNAFENYQSKSPNNTRDSNFNWAYRFFYYNPSDSIVPMSSDTFNWATDRIKFQTVGSINGNLTLFDIEPNFVHVLSTYIYKNGSNMVPITPNWDGGLSIFINSGYIVKTNTNSFTSQQIYLPLNSGWSQLDIYLYTKETGKSFSLNSTIGAYADDWQTPEYDIPITPQNIIASVDSNSSNKKDPNTIVVRWDKLSSDGVVGYNINRRGPYLTGISTPTISSSLSSGYFLSGINILNRDSYYRVSASIDSVGEGLASEISRVQLDPVFSGINYSSGLPLIMPGGALKSGEYYYYVIGARYPIGYKYPSNMALAVYVADTSNSILLSWSGVDSVQSYDVYRYSGINWGGDFDASRGYLTGALIANVSNATVSFLDTGISVSTFSGYKALLNNSINYNFDFSSNASYINNSVYLSWSPASSSVSGNIVYKIYRSSYSGVFDAKSLVGTTTNTFIIDSGLYSGLESPLYGKPTSYENIASVSYGATKYKDTSIIKNQMYDYALSSYNSKFMESPQSTGYSVIAGDQFAPLTPTNITITSFNGFATLGWVNGGESDLAGTIIYQSGVSGYLEIARTTANSYTQFIGYSGSPWFKLANYDTSDNISVLSSAYQGSGTFVAENIILKSFRTLSSLDVDLELYVPSGFNTSNSAMTRMQMGAIHCPSGVYQTYTVSAPPFLGLGLERFAVAPGSIQYSTYSPDDVLGGTVAIPINSGFGFAAIEESRLNRYHLLNVAYYSGRMGTANLYLENMCFEGKSGAPSIAYTLLSGNTTGIFVGDWILNQWPYGDNEYSNALMNPVVATNSGFVDKQVIIYVSGTSSTNTVSFGFTSSNRSGTYIGPEKYLTIDGADISPRDGFSSAMDYDGNIHLFYMGSGLSPSTNKLRWFKLDYQTKNNNPITILASGSYTNNGKGGYLFPQEPNPFILGEPRVFIDELNNIYIFQKGNRSNAVVAAPFKKTIFASQVDKNGNVQVFPNSIYQLPFEFESTWGISYTPVGNLAYSWYTLGKTATGSSLFPQRNLTYNYQAGVYRRMHPLEFYNNSSLYQILQSIIK